MFKNIIYAVFFVNLSLIADFSELKKTFKQKLNSEVPDWMNQQINKDLSDAKKKVKSFKLKSELIKWASKNPETIIYKIKNNKIWIHSGIDSIFTGLLSDRVAKVNNILKTLSKLVRLPNLEFALYLGDTFNGNSKDIPGVIFGVSKDKYLDKNVILIPNFQILDFYPNILKKIQDFDNLCDFKSKKNILFWTGDTTGGNYNLENYKEFPRMIIVTLSLKFPELINARYQNLVQMDENLKNYLEKFALDSSIDIIQEHTKYKYQLSLDGNGSDFDLYYKLFLKATLLKQNSDYIQWYSNALTKYKHYIPVKNNLSNLSDQIKLLQEDSDKAKEISENMNDFALNNLQLADNLYYFYLVLKKYSEML